MDLKNYAWCYERVDEVIELSMRGACALCQQLALARWAGGDEQAEIDRLHFASDRPLAVDVSLRFRFGSSTDSTDVLFIQSCSACGIEAHGCRSDQLAITLAKNAQ